jgi:NAD(P)-dependent dehydrogenase (short-subunit alcohol dehydrogenase family)
MTAPRTILVTGSSSGFGRLISETLARRGHTVFASMRELAGRNADSAAALSRFDGGEIHPIEIDVASDASVERGVAGVLAATGGRLDAVVNNAAIGTLGPEESYTAAEFMAVFDTNVAGAQRVNRAALPAMRARGEGLLIHVTSTGGRLVYPGMGLYGATKFALEALAEAYAYELAPLGVESVVVQPGGFPTGFMASARLPADSERGAAYGPLGAFAQQFQGMIAAMRAAPDAPDAQLVADAVARLVEAAPGTRPLRTVVDPAPSSALMAQINRTCEEAQAATLRGMGMEALLRVTVPGSSDTVATP